MSEPIVWCLKLRYHKPVKMVHVWTVKANQKRIVVYRCPDCGTIKRKKEKLIHAR